MSEELDRARQALEAAATSLLDVPKDKRTAQMISLAGAWTQLASARQTYERGETVREAGQESEPAASSARERVAYVHQGMEFHAGQAYRDAADDEWVIVGWARDGVPLVGHGWHLIYGTDTADTSIVVPLPYAVRHYGLSAPKVAGGPDGLLVTSEKDTGPADRRVHVPVPHTAAPRADKVYRSLDGETYWRVAGSLDDGTAVMRDWHGYTREWGEMLKTWSQVLEDHGPLTFDRD